MPVYNYIPKIEDDMQGATETEAGKAGLVPAPPAGEENRALMADGSWRVPSNTKNAEKLDGVSLFFPYRESFKEEASILPAFTNEFGEKVFNVPCKIQIIDEDTDKIMGEIFTTTETVDGETKTTLIVMVEGYLANDILFQAKTVTAEQDLEVKGNANIKGNCAVAGSVNSGKNVSAVSDVCGGTRVISGAKAANEITKQMRMGTSTLIAYAPAESGDVLIPTSFRLGGKPDKSTTNEPGVSEVRLSTCCATNDNSDTPALVPIVNKKSSLGLSNYLWKQLYASTTTISTSDKNLKKDITPFSEKYEKLFFDLQPSVFRFIEGESGRTHAGFISQDVEEALQKNDLSALDFAGFCKDQKTKTVIGENGEEKEVPAEGEYVYSLRYEEFIALNTHMIQKLYDKIENLEKKLKENGIEV